MNTKRQLPIATSCFGTCAALLVVAAWVTAQEHGAQKQPAASRRPVLIRELHREGTKFEGVGRFEMAGDQATFVCAEREESFRVLENLALERVARVLTENREPREWSVTGVFTEYQGGNCLLLTRAVVKQPTARRLPRT